MTRPPTLPLLAPGEAEWAEMQRVWRGTDEAEARLQVLRPFLAEAIRSIAIKQDLLLDEAWASLLAGIRVVKRNTLPSDPRLFQLHLSSMVLRVNAEEQGALTSRLHDPMVAWHAFRHRVNRLRRSFRRYLLASLPRHALLPSQDVIARRQPTRFWTRLWDELVDGIPKGCLPREWCMVREAAEADQPQVASSSLLVPGHGLSPRRDWKELLARPLHRAAALLESRRPAKVDLILPKGVIPDRPRKFAQEFLDGLAPYGDLPKGDGDLEAAMDLMKRLANPSIEASTDGPSILLLAQLAEEHGFSKFKSLMFTGTAIERAGDFQASYWDFSRGLSEAVERRQAAVALNNLSIQAFMMGSVGESLSLCREGLRYNPTSPLALGNYQLLLRLARLWEAGEHG
jgi:hypothetical protein